MNNRNKKDLSSDDLRIVRIALRCAAVLIFATIGLMLFYGVNSRSYEGILWLAIMLEAFTLFCSIPILLFMIVKRKWALIKREIILLLINVAGAVILFLIERIK